MERAEDSHGRAGSARPGGDPPARDDPSSALDLLDRACAIKERMGDVNGTANSQNSRAMALLRLGACRKLAPPSSGPSPSRPRTPRPGPAATSSPPGPRSTWFSGAVDVALDGYRDALRQPGIAGTDAQARASVQLDAGPAGGR
jgi:hypothetical protein